MVQQTKVAPDLLGTFRQDLLRPLRCLGIDVGKFKSEGSHLTIWQMKVQMKVNQSSSRFNYLNRGCFDLHRFDGPARRSTCDLDAWSHLEPPHASNLTVLERLRGFWGAALVSAAKNARKRNQPRDIVKPGGLKHHQCLQTTCDRLKGCKEHIKIQSCVMSVEAFNWIVQRISKGAKPPKNIQPRRSGGSSHGSCCGCCRSETRLQRAKPSPSNWLTFHDFPPIFMSCVYWRNWK